MSQTKPLEVLFLTNFSDACYRAIPALAQMSDELDVRLTILHAVDPFQKDSASASKKIASFFPEADAYRLSRRLIASGPVVECAKRHCQEHHIDLIVAPCSDPLGWPRVGAGSVRTRLLAECQVPVWTISQRVTPAIFSRPTKNVGCWLNLDAPDVSHIALAFEYAATTGARLHLLQTLPEIGESALTLPFSSDLPLNEQGAQTTIRNLLGSLPVEYEVHVGTGRPGAVMEKMVRDLQLDILFVGEAQAIRKSWFGTSMSLGVRRCVCPVVYSSSGCSAAAWQLQRGAAFRNRKAMRTAA